MWRALVLCGLLLSAGCSYRTLKFFFDGVPDPEAAKPAPVAEPEPGAVPTRIFYSEHAPYAEKQCEACHNPDATNRLVASDEELCFQCHDFQTDKKYVHGPVVSGGCLVCHDPHNSKYRFLLKSESDSFCFDCHDEPSVLANAAHKDTELQCTSCHDAHMSDKRFLLK